MFTSIAVNGFTGVPYLETSMLMQNHGGKIVFSTNKPNVIVGPNGAGKSALITALSLRTLSFYTGESAFDDHYAISNEERAFWNDGGRFGNQFEFLPGLTCETDNAPAVYYRPNHVPGNNHWVGDAMACGYSKLANAYLEKTNEKSSGQQSRALLEGMMDALAGKLGLPAFKYAAWSKGKFLPDVDTYRGHVCDFEYKLLVLKKLFANVAPTAKLLVMADEPEQSLDAKARAQLWRAIAAADCSKVQVIIASHSSYPLRHPEKFNLIEAVPGFAQEVLELES